MAQHHHYQAGVGKTPLRIPAAGLGMMGYGRADHVVADPPLPQTTPLHARAFCLAAASGPALFFVQLELCMVFPELKRALLARLRETAALEIDEARLLLCASHTHSAPGGYAHFPFYNFSVPGFRPAVFEVIVRGACEAVQQAWQTRQPALLKFGSGDFAADDTVAFNRSLRAWRRNPGAAAYDADQAHLAIERRMFLLLAQSPQGRCIGQINWFGVHPTSISSRNRYVSYDNKGYAAEALEQALGEGTVAIFAQQFAGDVSPNAQSRKLRWPRGPYRDDSDSARDNGQRQCAQALRIIDSLREAPPLADGPLDAALLQRDFSQLAIDADLAGAPGLRSSEPCHGLAFFRGSPIDGPGAPAPVAALLGLIARLLRWRERRFMQGEQSPQALALRALHTAQAPKLVVSHSAQGRVLGLQQLHRLPGFLDPMVTEIARQDRAGALKEKPWVPCVLPLQYWRLGPLAVIGFPGEITTEAGRQLRSLCRELLAPLGIREVLVSSYANSYFGYCTTWHEYQAQQYEGGHTTFGNQTHHAFLGEYRRLLRECLKPAAQRQLHSDAETSFSAATLAARSRD